MEKFKQILLHRHKTIASLAHALQISKSVVHRRVKEGIIRRHSSAIKPQLTDQNKETRLQFCLSMIQEQSSGKQDVLGGLDLLDTATHYDNLGVEQLVNTLSSKFACLDNFLFIKLLVLAIDKQNKDINGRPEFKFLEMVDYVVIDEKWFYM
ncbi:hypothetical protein Leryth_005383 [Lithospermum erythrorhizon]|nr:hypothetical protein Leryth_005383 [Lithospermum erythrorhizon]